MKMGHLHIFIRYACGPTGIMWFFSAPAFHHVFPHIPLSVSRFSFAEVRAASEKGEYSVPRHHPAEVIKGIKR
jgi:hypothetical protein